jgi:hypothetical protein
LTEHKNKFEIKLLGVWRGGREREERFAGNKLGKKLLEFDKHVLCVCHVKYEIYLSFK